MVTMHGRTDWNDTAAPARGSWTVTVTGYAESHYAARGLTCATEAVTGDATGNGDGHPGRAQSPVNREDVPDRSAEHREDE